MAPPLVPAGLASFNGQNASNGLGATPAQILHAAQVAAGSVVAKPTPKVASSNGILFKTSPAGKPVVNVHNTVTSPAASARATQQYLQRLGYSVAVDGIMGPQTQAAISAHQKGISAKAWNAAQRGTTTTAPPASTTAVSPTGAVPPAANPVVPPPSNTPAGASSQITLEQLMQQLATQLPSSNASAIQAIGNGYQNYQVNAGQTATAAANAQYNPAISGLQQQVKQGMAQGKTDQADISGWYNTLVANMNQRASSEATAGNNEVAQINAVAPGTSAALGFSPGTAGANNIDAGGAIQTNAARMANQANAEFNGQLAGVTAAQGRASQVNQANIDRNNVVGLQNQVIAQQQARGNDVTALTAQNRQQNMTNNNNYIGQKLSVNAAVQAARQQNYSNQSAAASGVIAGQTADANNDLLRSEAGLKTNQGIADVANAGTNAVKGAASAKASLINAKAGLLRAQNGTLTAKAAQTRAATYYATSMAKANSLAAQVFPGVTGTNIGKTGGSIVTAISGRSDLADLQANPRMLAGVVQQQMAADGADLTSPRAKQYAITMMQILGATPTAAQAAQWFNFGGKPKAKLVRTGAVSDTAQQAR